MPRVVADWIALKVRADCVPVPSVPRGRDDACNSLLLAGRCDEIGTAA